MNREQLEQLVLDELGTLDTDAMRLVDKLWPVLAQVWGEGYEQGWDDRAVVRDGHLSEVTASNPYGEVPR